VGAVAWNVTYDGGGDGHVDVCGLLLLHHVSYS